MKTITITLKFFGAFRRQGAGIVLEVPAHSTVAVVKQTLADALHAPEKALVPDAVLADETQVLPDNHAFNTTCQLAILPPVCGG